MAWTIEFDEAAVKRLRKMAHDEANLRERVAPLADPRQTGKALKGGALGALWRHRVGECRILCNLQDGRLIVLIVEIRHRREVYR